MMLKIEEIQPKRHDKPIDKAWLESQLGLAQFDYFLAHTETGVMWGRVEGKQLLLSTELENIDQALLPKPIANLARLHMARLFSQQAEWLLWRDGNGRYYSRLIQDDANINRDDILDEEQILWGTEALPLENGFTVMSDGAQGLRHVVPIVVNLPEPVPTHQRPLRLHVRHYIGGGKHGRIVASRLCHLRAVNPKEQADVKNA